MRKVLCGKEENQNAALWNAIAKRFVLHKKKELHLSSPLIFLTY
jgi:hypothetical protein